MTGDYDLLVKNGRIVTGLGNPWFRGDVCIKNGRVAGVGRIREHVDAESVIDANGLIVAPGFIDTHSHYGLKIIEDKKCEPLIMQGITTALFGQDGFSTAPSGSSDHKETLKKYLSGLDGETRQGEWSWHSFGEYLSSIQANGSAVNFASLVGHGTIRLCVMGFSLRGPTAPELESMCHLLRTTMKEGAMGMSTGLVYPPSMYAETEELIEMCKVLREAGGVYFSHVRGEGNNLIPAFQEAVRIGRESGVPVQISHHKVIGQSNWSKARESIVIVTEAREKEGLDITTDQYPYSAGSTTLTALLPPWSLEGGIEQMLARLKEPKTRRNVKRDAENGLPGWEGYALFPETVMVSYCRRTKEFEGMTLSEIAEMHGKLPTEELFDILVENDGVASCVLYQQSEENVKLIMKNSFSGFCSDGIATGRPHPRLYGTFPRVLGRYVRVERVLELEEAIRKMTSLPAQRLGIADRGVLQVGMFADVVIFDAEKVIDNATYENPFQFPTGIEYVIVNGQIVVKRAEHTGALPGAVIRGPSFQYPGKKSSFLGRTQH